MLSDDISRTLSYYVYYRIRANADHGDARRRVRAMQQRLADTLGLTCRLLQRRDDEHTWMEVYETVTDATGFEIALKHEVEAARIQDLIEPGSARHIERFVECA